MAYPKVNQKQFFPKLEEEVLKFWKENKIFEKSIESRPAENPYRFYDWPPFITWTPHYGSLLSSICKDVVPRYHTMKWKRCERVWGWDCHGIPIEDKVQKELWLHSNKEIEDNGIDKFIEWCYRYTRDTSAEWERYIDHIGRWVDFKNSYKTMDKNYMESTIWVFKTLYDKWMIYKGQRISLYSWKLSTPISNFEIAMDDSYEEVSDPAITVMFPVTQESKHVKVWDNILAWTTTPWTIPAHMALAVNSEIAYSRVKTKVYNNWKGISYGRKLWTPIVWENESPMDTEPAKDCYLILATARIEAVFGRWAEYEIVDSFMWKDLVWLKYKPPFDYYVNKIDSEKNFRVYNAEFITDSDWTGIAHQAPEFWDVDFDLAKENGIHITSALNNEWRYTDEILDLKWTLYRDANDLIAERLKEKWILFKKESITHRVAMCPRTWTPLIHKAQDSWFIDIQNLKDKLIEENEWINWSPEHLKHGQFLKSMEAAPDWCISRTRYRWTPMPIWMWYDQWGNQKDMKVFGSIKEIEKASGMKVTDLHRPYIDEITWEENWLTYKRVSEVLDCWVESGSMPYAQDHYPFENKEKMESAFPADFIVEYIGQVRAWFYVMHVLWVALFGKRAYTNVITTWIVNGSDGRKMSKSYKNYPDPRATIEKYGADAIRFYMVNSPLLSGWNLSFKEEQVHEVVKKVILPLWNTYSFFTTYANIDNFETPKWNVYFVRHWESERNTTPWLMNPGDVDSPLTEKWIKQAIEAWKQAKMEWLKFDIIISSPLSRAYDTAVKIAEETWYTWEILKDDRLIEQLAWKLKDYTHTQITEEFKTKSVAENRRVFRDKKYNGVEDTVDFEKRTLEFIEEMTKKYEWKNVLVVAHTWVSRPFNKYYFNISTDEAFFERDSVPNARILKMPNLPIKNPLDKWLFSELHKLIDDVTKGFEEYKLNEATRPIIKFMDNLTNWYIRRSRKRFWKSENDSDKIEAYNTLHEVLVTLSKVISPFMPFVSEHIYKNLTWKESVHLTVFPDWVKAFIDDRLNRDMDETQKIITLWLAWRANHKIRVRQPLSTVTIAEELNEYYSEIIKEELNVKEVVVTDWSKLAKQVCKPNGRLIWPKFGKDVKFIMSEAKAWNFEELENGNVLIPLPNPPLSWEGTKWFELEKWEFELVFEAWDSSYDIESGFGMVIAMNPEITEDLKLEWYARDIVRQIQESRKEAGYEVDDRINISIEWIWESKQLVADIVKNFWDYIEKETLSSIDSGLSGWDLEKKLEMEGVSLKLVLRR